MKPSKSENRPRDRAIRVLVEVLSNGRALDDVLTVMFQESPDHHPWMQDVCSGVLRWKGRLDLAIDSIALKKKPTGWLRKALWVAAYQLFAQDDVNPTVVVNETVELVREREGKAPAGFANALLRRLAEKRREWAELPFPARASMQEKAQWASLPIWIWEPLALARGEAWAAEYAMTSLKRPTLWLRAREGWSPEPGDLAVAPASLKGALQVLKAERPLIRWSGFETGAFFVQDISSQKLVQEVTEILRKRKATSVLDLCAAPGGKSVGLAWNGFRVVATDSATDRLGLIRQNFRRLGVEGGSEVVELKSLAAASDQYDAVWVDAPCTGSGILRRHPDVRWLKTYEDVRSLNRLQRELLAQAWERVRPGGALIYSVCSVLPSEGRELVRSFQTPGAEWGGEFELLPQEAPFGDGFYLGYWFKGAPS